MQSDGRKHDVTCPWTNEHTDQIDHGAVYFEPDDDHPTGGFKCQHSHGDNYRIGQLLDFLNIKPEAARGKARIDVVAGEMNRVRRAAEKTLALRGGYYQAGGAIVVICTDPATKDISTELLTEAPLTSALADAADWYRYDGRTQKSVRTDRLGLRSRLSRMPLLVWQALPTAPILSSWRVDKLASAIF